MLIHKYNTCNGWEHMSCVLGINFGKKQITKKPTVLLWTPQFGEIKIEKQHKG
jgi:hypothetical protein